MKCSTFPFVFLSLVAIGCGRSAGPAVHSPDAVLDSVSQDRWTDLASRRIFFAHMSLGHNIVQGVQELGQEDSRVRLRVIETRSPADLNRPALAHALNGENGDPIGKIKAFRSALDAGLAAKLDVALLKFCYVDFRTNRQVPEVFDEYKRTMAALKADYPHLTLVHTTVPLTVVQTGPKAWVKRMIGRPAYGVNENKARTEFNQLIRREYEGKEPLFDVANWEATRADGSRSQFFTGDEAYDELAVEYAADGGHLNAGGRRWIASQFLAFLAGLPLQDAAE